MNKFRYYFQEIIHSVTKGLFAYLKATLKLAFLSLIILSIGLFMIGVDFWFLKALGIAIVDIFPVLGSGMVMIPWAVIHLLMGHTTIAWKIGLLYIVMVVVRQVAEPIITGKSIGVRPIYTFLATVISMLIFGPIGAVLGAVITIVLKAVLEVKSFQSSPPTDRNPFYNE
ncbi:AI-2E family transporter [Jeotgalibaca sp. MA1X17-3]|uniref:AI-2E family transporter n=1 Tax=Jeotgalibaca sp. MA1X17-3 TaxID=2908211 RepID=UPI001F38D91B|nr:AI-2E family transporter [Jeotgalibaca sp. MA1X17-3]UJF16337.1 AI-2E family transporter [Jeotgalibaca sp. MA1X17-3]